MFIVKYYLLIAISCFIGAVFAPNIATSIALVWTGTSLALVVVAYLYDIPSIFKKSEDGKLTWWIRWAFIPFLLGVKAYNFWARAHDPVPAIHKITSHLYVSRRLLRSELDELSSRDITSIVDVTAEFAGLESAVSDKQFDYLNIPVLDHKAPKSDRLRHALNWIDLHVSRSESVVVHCALGRGRSVFVVAAYLLSKDTTLSVEQVLKQLNDVRSTARLNSYQVSILKSMKSQGLLKLDSPAWLIANPVAGGGKWKIYQRQLIHELTKKYRLIIRCTEPGLSANDLAKEAISDDVQLVIAAGGDGTLSEVASVLNGSDTRMGMIPFGTANALCHVLYGIETKANPVGKPCAAILSGQTKKIDTAYCNDSLMLLVLGIGFEQQMIEYSQREEKNAKGQIAYLSGFFNAIIEDKATELTYQIDDQPKKELTVRSLVIANTAPFTTVLAQGGSEPTPEDGLLHMTYLDESNTVSGRILALSDITLSALGVKDTPKHFRYQTAERVEIQADHVFDYVVDGEPFQGDHLIIEIHKKSLNVCLSG
ncbi:Diacylglycerol kinase [Vibrio aerogenes CECT 7868]|uniref:Diacylglycerol kinase n=1 Tax=Vibrio aerogenes CECT 7868 TaxID=1216006 RepID=A0A1M6DIZ5_9VIBR|nr:diacylglycerol kinase family protein [Vibrio aerogenes]SHI73162.1 Diacylglycerol kinase [Vibrio aerogenes CECT 7868]